MANPLTKKTSFLLLRTNPRLTTNIKIISDSKDGIFLESFDNISELSSSKYKGFKVSPGSKYSFDLSKFYGSGSVPESISYSTFESDDYLSAKDNFNRQYDFKYNAGSYAKTSKLYTEEFACFAPLWIEKDNIPDYFVIFKTLDPVSINTNSPLYEEDPSLFDVSSNNFFENIIKKSNILKTIDLTERTNIGKYIRSHVNDESFPEAPLTIGWNEDDNSTWNGISYFKGGFVNKGSDVSKDLVLKDKTIIEFENYITNGFRSNGVVVANILNLEFLFDDVLEEDFKINRYFGMYCTEAEIGRFQSNGEKLFSRRTLELEQLPIPTTNNVIGSKTNTVDQIQFNENGIKMYIDLLEGGVITPSYVSDYPLFGYVKDKNNNLYSIKNGVSWLSDELRIDNTAINWKNFTGFDEPRNYIKSELITENLRSTCILTLSGSPDAGTEIRVKNTGYKIGYVGSTANLSIGYTADYPTGATYPDIIVNEYTIQANAGMTAQTFSKYFYSNQGDINKIAIAIAGALNLIMKPDKEKEIFTAKAINNQVVIISTIPSETLNELKLSIFSQGNTNIGVSGSNGTYTVTGSYIATPVQFSTGITGNLLVTNFVGANSNKRNKVKINSDDVGQITTDQYIKTTTGYSKIKQIFDFIDVNLDRDGLIGSFNDYGKYKVIEVEDNQEISLNSSSQCTLYELTSFGMGFLSFYPVKDFDFDIFTSDYSKDADSYTLRLSTYISDKLYLAGFTGFTGSAIGTSSSNAGLTILNTTIGASSSFYQAGEFNTLRDIIDESTGNLLPINNEYDRLDENNLKELALESKIIPYINKWVYDDYGNDVRDNEYRLSPSESFGFSNFCPSFRHFGRDPKFFTHEWPLLQKYPPYLTLEEKKKSFSYFDEELVLSDLYRVDEDKFYDYFTVDSIGATVNIPTQLRYSIFSNGTSTRFAETFFRGVKVLIKDRNESDKEINYNLDDIKFKKSSKYNGYKFTSILTFGDSNVDIKVIKNDKFKNITFVTRVGIQDPLYTAPGYTGATSTSDRFIDRSILYTMSNKYDIETGIGTFTNGKLSPNYKNSNIDGQFNVNNFAGSDYGLVTGTLNVGNSSDTNYIRDIKLLDDGTYGDVVIRGNVSGVWYRFFGIFDVTLNQFKYRAFQIYGLYDPITDTFTSPAGITDGGSLYAPFNHPLEFLNRVPIYRGGGFGTYGSILEKISFANIAELINRGDPSIEYITIDSLGATSNNDFVLELLEPEYVIKSSSIKPIDDLNRPTSLVSNSKIGSDIVRMQNTYLHPISRYNGNYSPKVKDVITFSKSIKNLFPTLLSAFGDDKADLLTDNTVFDYQRPGFGSIPKLFYNKVNEENPRAILEISRVSGFLPKYPKINEISIDKKDFYIFASNWDPNYYDLYKDKSNKTAIIGTRSMTDKPSFFGSKIMSLPDEIVLETFRQIGLSEIGDLSLIENFAADLVTSKSINESNPRSTENSKIQDSLLLDVFCDLALREWLLNNGITDVFDTFVNPTYSFGSPTSIDDDKIEYIKQNVLSRYYVDEIIFWESLFKTNKKSLGNVVTDLTDIEKFNSEMKRSTHYRLDDKNIDALRFRLIYNIGKNDDYSISVTVKLKKK